MQDTPYTWPIVIAGLVPLGAALFALRRRARYGRAFAFVAIAVAATNLTYGLELALSSLDGKLALLHVRWAAICVTPAGALYFALRWAGHDRLLTRRNVAGAAVIILLTIAAEWTNGWHGWFASPSVLVDRGAYVMRVADGRWLFWLCVLWHYGCGVAIVVVYLHRTVASPAHRRQGTWMLLATLLSWAGNALYVFGLVAEPALDTSGFGYGVAALAWALALTRERLLDLVPIARERLFDSLGDAVVVVDGDGRVLDLNPAARREFHAEAAIVGVRFDGLLGSAAPVLPPAGAGRAAMKRDGRDFEVDIAIISDHAGGDARLFTFRDVTEQRLAETRMAMTLTELEAANAARGEFLARMSHEVRTPLYAITGAAELLDGRSLDDATRRYATVIATSARSLMTVVDDLIDFARVEAGRMMVHLEAVDATALVRDVVRRYAAMAAAKGLSLTAGDAGSVHVHADPARLRQVVDNLVTNAIKFTNAGSVSVGVRRDGDAARIEVTDTGIGIAEPDVARIFEAFTQIDARPRDGLVGAGLGLSIAQRLCALMGARLEVTSTPGHGSTFAVHLRVDAAPATRRAVPARPRAPLRGRVLVIEDHPLGRLVTTELLEREGCTVECAVDAPSALAALASRTFQLVITDVRLPGRDGYQLSSDIRALPPPAGATPIIALSGDVVTGAAERARAAGMTAWLAKPVDAATLRAAIEPHLPAALETGGVAARSAPVSWARVIELFHESAGEDIGAIKAACAASDGPRVRDLSHRLKGAAELVGAHRLAALCGRLEGAPDEHLSMLAAQLDAAYLDGAEHGPRALERSA